jgi:amino acid adenylation domain-containing protein
VLLASLDYLWRSLRRLWLSWSLTGRGLALPLQVRAERGPAPLSFAQQRLWFLHRLAPANPFYNTSVCRRLCGKLDVKVLQTSLDGLVARHETLRTIFRADGETPVQVIGPPQPVALVIVDLTAVCETEREAEARRLVEAEALRPFDLAAGPLMRVQLLRLSAEHHVLQLTLHHIISDGWSIPVLYRDLGALYQAGCTGGEPSLAPLAVQYADFSVWQRRWLAGDVLSAHLDYWRSRLEGISELRLPTDRPRPAFPSYAGARETLSLPPELSAALRALGQRERATPYMVLLAAFNALLHRYTGQDDLVVGSPIANRTRAELEELIGFFVNSLTMRTDASGDPEFRALLARVRQVALGAYAHQDLPFERLVEALDPERDVSRNPLFQVMFAVQNAPGTAGPLAGTDLTISDFPSPATTTRFDLEVHVWEAAGQFRVDFVYSTDLFDGATIRRMLGHYERVLIGVVADPACRLSALPLLSDPERRQLLVEWNDTATAFPQDKCVHQLFEEHVARAPNAVAAAFEDRQLTYGELDARANQLAHQLIALGVGPETLVGVCLERSLDLIVALLGILKAGGGYMPLDPSYPDARLAFMLTDASAPVLITQQDLLERLPLFEGGLLCLDRDWSAISEQPDTQPPGRAAADNLAYVIYTSGSTGTPNGVCIPHRAVARLVRKTNYIAIGPGDVVAQAANASFDAITFELWGALCCGASVAIIETEALLSPPRLAASLREHGVTTMFLTTALFNQLVRAIPEALGAFRNLLVGGEAADPARMREALEKTPPLRLVHVYGPTETTTFATWHHVTAVPPTARTVPIGRPIANTRIYILDRWGQPAPLGVPGEICIGGAGVARGYLNRSELTAERFVADPFADAPDARMYRTGDLARYRPDGEVEFLGRLDDQVKLRGFRIELGEIEAALAEHPAVRQAVAMLRQDTPDDKRLVAYIVAANPPADLLHQLRSHLVETLPRHMAPSAFVILDRLPLTPNGKVDRKALPAPHRSGAEADYVAPRTPTEEIVAGIWAEALGLERIGAEDNFFDLGGHSLLATKTLSVLRERTGVDLPVSMIFESPTPATLAERIDVAQQTNGSGNSAAVKTAHPFAELADPLAGSGPMAIEQILNKQQVYVKTWRGKRLTPESFIVTLNEAGARPGLFWCLQGFDELTELAKHLGPSQPVHGIRSGHLIMEYSKENIAAIASYYAAEMIEVQPDGPFLIGGNCQGGLIAVAIALRLQELGRGVSRLVLMEQGLFPPYEGPVALIFGRDSIANPYTPGSNPDIIFRNAYPAGYTVDIISGGHGEFFQSPNIETLAEALMRRLWCREGDSSNTN